jgi:hypothetical protein
MVIPNLFNMTALFFIMATLVVRLNAQTTQFTPVTIRFPHEGGSISFTGAMTDIPGGTMASPGPGQAYALTCFGACSGTSSVQYKSINTDSFFLGLRSSDPVSETYLSTVYPIMIYQKESYCSFFSGGDALCQVTQNIFYEISSGASYFVDPPGYDETFTTTMSSSSFTLVTFTVTSLPEVPISTSGQDSASASPGASVTSGSSTSTPSNTSTPDEPKSAPSKKISGGAIAGIAIGIVAVILIICLVIVCLCMRSRRRAQIDTNSPPLSPVSNTHKMAVSSLWKAMTVSRARKDAIHELEADKKYGPPELEGDYNKPVEIDANGKNLWQQHPWQPNEMSEAALSRSTSVNAPIPASSERALPEEGAAVPITETSEYLQEEYAQVQQRRARMQEMMRLEEEENRLRVQLQNSRNRVVNSPSELPSEPL